MIDLLKRQGDLESQRIAALALCNIACNKATHHIIMGHGGIVLNQLLALTVCYDSDVRLYGALAICNMIANHECHAVLRQNSRTLPALLALVKTDNWNLQLIGISS